MDDERIKVWYGLRIKAIRDKIEAHDILRSNGVTFRHTGDREEQFSCPFHGKDEKPSARVFPSNARSPSHVWCYVCRERWDVIALWKKYNGGEIDGKPKGFHRVLSEIEKHYNITPPPVPEGAFKSQPSGDEKQRTTFDHLFQSCEARLVSERTTYRELNDMAGYLVAGSVMDKVLFQVSEGHLSYLDGTVVLKKLMQKIGERIRSGSTSQVVDA